MIDAFGISGNSFILALSVKRRRAMQACNPIEE
jgi:hypothetical protein